LGLGTIVLAMAVVSNAERVAILSPAADEQAAKLAESLSTALEDKVTVLDNELAGSAFRSVTVADPFNLTSTEATRIGTVIGCDRFILIKSDTFRRSSLERPDYYEAFAAIYVVSSRTGRLLFWKLLPAEGSDEASARKGLADIVDSFPAELIKAITAPEDLKPARPIEEVPADGSPASRNFRAPVPYLRLKPEYTRLAYLYNVKATVEAEVDLDEHGNVMRAEIVRWAGFGLDDAVIDVIHKMNWRPAERNGKTLPMRILLRYNFKKLES
jgi:hypothetical protein